MWIPLLAVALPAIVGKAGESKCSGIVFTREELSAVTYHGGRMDDIHHDLAEVRAGEREIVARGARMLSCFEETIEREHDLWSMWFIKRIDPARAQRILAAYACRSDLGDLEVLAAARAYGPGQAGLIAPRVIAILRRGSVGLSGNALLALSFLNARESIPAIRKWLADHPTLPSHLQQNRILAEQVILRLEGRADTLYEQAAGPRPQGFPLWLLRDMGRWDLIERLSREAQSPFLRAQTGDFLRARDASR